MTKRKLPRIIYFIVCFLLIFEQSGFAQVAAQLDIAGQLTSLHNSLVVDKFRPVHLRYLQYDSLSNNFRLFLDKGDEYKGFFSQGPISDDKLKTLLKYFFIGLSLSNDKFWVNLRPDAEDNIIDDYLAKTDIGRIMLESDLQLKKDTAQATSPQTPEGREYWDKLYSKAGELFGSENITIPTLTRPWIVPDEIIIRETIDSAYVYKATLKVMLEQDYLKDSTVYNFKDERLKQLNEYSSQLIRESIIPKLTKEINTSKRYAPLRQVYYSLILAQWFKARHKELPPQGTVSNLINSQDLTNLISKDPWSKTTYFQAYQKSFKDGEYNIQEPVYTPTGQVIRSYFSGGMMLGLKTIPGIGSSPINKQGDTSISIIPASAGSPIFNSKLGKLLSASLIGLSLMLSGDQVEKSTFNFDPKAIISNYYSSSGQVQEVITQDMKIYSQEQEKIIPLLKERDNNNTQALNKIMQIIKDRNYSKETRIRCIYYLSETLLGNIDFPLKMKEAALAALRNLLEFDEADIQKAVTWNLRDYADGVVLALRNAHLAGRISNIELEKELEKLTFNNPFLLYLCYTSPENFGDLAKMILQKLQMQAANNRKDLLIFLKESDPQGIFYGDFILQTGNFSHLKYLLSSPDNLRQILNSLFRDLSENNISKQSLRFALFFEGILRDKNFAYQQEFQYYIRKLYDLTSGKNRLLISALLNVYRDELLFLSKEDIRAIGARDGIKMTSDQVSYGRLFKDGTLVVHIVFADSDAAGGHFIPTLNFFQGKDPRYPQIKGYAVIDSQKNNVTLQNGDIKIVLFNAVKDTYDIDKNLKEASIIESRTHAGNERKVFKTNTVKDADGKIGFISSCRSASIISRIRGVYKGAEFIGTNDTTLGDMTNIVTFYMLDGLKKRLPQWKQIKQNVAEHLPGASKNYIFPGDMATQVQSIVGIPEEGPIDNRLEELLDRLQPLRIVTPSSILFASSAIGKIPFFGSQSEQKAESIEPIKKSGSSLSSAINPSTPGGIDFRNFPIVTQALSNLRLSASSAASLSQLQNLNLNQELQDIQKMAEAGITPSTDRIKEYVASSCLSGNLDTQKVASCIADILRLEEERCSLTEPMLKDILIVLESGRSAQELKTVFIGNPS